MYCNPDKCPHCQYIGDGDSWCDELHEIVLSDWEPTEHYMGPGWCAPRQVDSEIIYILRMKILPAYHMVLGAMQPVDGHGLP